MSEIPDSFIFSMLYIIVGLFAIGINGFAFVSVKGRSLVPFPAQSIRAFIVLIPLSYINFTYNLSNWFSKILVVFPKLLQLPSFFELLFVPLFPCFLLLLHHLQLLRLP